MGSESLCLNSEPFPFLFFFVSASAVRTVGSVKKRPVGVRARSYPDATREQSIKALMYRGQTFSLSFYFMLVSISVRTVRSVGRSGTNRSYISNTLG